MLGRAWAAGADAGRLRYHRRVLLWLAIGGALAGSLARWRLAEARHDRAAAAAAAVRQARRRRRGRARITRLEATGATLLGMPAVRLHVELDLADRVAPIVFTRALNPAQRAWIEVGALLDLTYDPDDLTNFATELEGRFVDEVAERAQRPHARVELAAPLWALGHHGADAWLLPAPDPDAPAPRIVIGAFGGDRDAPALASAAFLAADELALTTTARPAVTVIVDPATRAIAGDADHPALTDGLVVWHAPLDAASLAVRIHRERGASPPLLTASLTGIPGALAAALVAAELAAAVEPPAWFRVPRGAAAVAYASLVPGLVRQLLADPERGALDPLPPAAHGELVDRAIAAAHAHDDGLVHLVALASCVQAARAGGLTIEQRVYASELVRQYAGTGHPIDLLGPSYLALFGLRAAARDRLRALRGRTAAFRSVESPYHAWLARRFA